MKEPQKTILYYVDNNSEDLKKFNDFFSVNPKFDVKTSTSVQNFYWTLRGDINTDKHLKIVIINSYIYSEELNTNTALQIVPMIKGLDNNIEIITFSEGSDEFINPTKSDIKTSDFVKKNKDFFIILVAVINEMISRKEANKFSLIFRTMCIILSVFLSIIGLLMLFMYYYKE